MKKILLFTSILFFAFSIGSVKAQTVNTITISAPITCYGDQATATVCLNQTTPPNPVSIVLQFQNVFGWWVTWANTAQTTGLCSNFPSLIPGNYQILVVDST